MTVSNLKGVAWDVIVLDGGRRVEIQRLQPMRPASGEPMDNDVFASDGAAREFVEQLAKAGDEEAVQALLMVAQCEDLEDEEEVFDEYAADVLLNKDIREGRWE